MQKRRKKKKKEKIPRTAAELIEFTTVGEDDKSNLSITKNRELISLLQQTISSFCKGYLSIYLILNSLKLHSPSSHLLISFFLFLEIYINLSYLDSSNLFFFFLPLPFFFQTQDWIFIAKPQ